MKLIVAGVVVVLASTTLVQAAPWAKGMFPDVKKDDPNSIAHNISIGGPMRPKQGKLVPRSAPYHLRFVKPGWEKLTIGIHLRKKPEDGKAELTRNRKHARGSTGNS